MAYLIKAFWLSVSSDARPGSCNGEWVRAGEREKEKTWRRERWRKTEADWELLSQHKHCQTCKPWANHALLLLIYSQLIALGPGCNLPEFIFMNKNVRVCVWLVGCWCFSTSTQWQQNHIPTIRLWFLFVWPAVWMTPLPECAENRRPARSNEHSLSSPLG